MPRIRTKRWVYALPLAALGLLAGACGDDPPPPAAAPPPPAAKGLDILTKGSEEAEAAGTPAPADAAPAPTGDTPAPGDGEIDEVAYAYSPIGKRDPFRSLFDQLRREEQEGKKTELQRFEVDQLKLVAIVSRIATPYAMVEDPGGKGHTLRKGTLMGKNWGRVSEINPQCVVLKEEYRDYTGRKITNKINMCLPKPEEELKLD